ncbi:MAG TPA: MFS transporter [Aquiluna sp.]
MSADDFRKRRLIAPVYLPSLLFTAAEGALLPILPVSAVLYGFSLAEAAIVTTVLMVGTLIFEVPAARITTRIGERNSILLASVMGALLLLLAFFDLGYGALLAAALGFGAAHSLFGLARHSLLSSLVPAHHRPRSMSLLGGMFRGGFAIGPVVGAGFIALFGVQSGYLVAAVMILAAGISVLSVKAERIVTPKSGLEGGIWAVAKQEAPKLATLGVASAIISAGRTIRLIGLPLLAIQLGIGPAESSFIFGITGFIDFALFYLSGIIMDRYGKFWSSVPTLLALGAAYLFSFMVTDVFSFWVLASVTALANAASAGINMVLGADLAPPNSRPQFLASFRILTSGGVAVAPAMISALTATVGLAGALATTGLLNFVGAYLFWRYLPVYAPDAPKPDKGS